MKRVKHILKCAIQILIQIIRRLLHMINYERNKLSSIIRCLHCARHCSDTRTAVKELAYYHPDLGHLAKIVPFETKEAQLDLSIIIPVYNTEKYIDECMVSILGQETGYSLEIILVNDGSTDCTGEHLKKYLHDSRVQLIEQKNAGQSASRNKAISKAKGKYLMFVDSDDVIYPGAIDKLMQEAISGGSEIVEGRVVRFQDHITPTNFKGGKKRKKAVSNMENPRFVLTCMGYSVAKVYKRELWETLRFPEGYIFEDVITKFILRRQANRVVFLPDPVYGYRYHQNSSSHSTSSRKTLDSIWVLPKIVELCRQEQAPMDGIFYLLVLNHIGLLNYITTRQMELEVRSACFAQMQQQLQQLLPYRPKHLPLFFFLLEKTILIGDIKAWNMVAETICTYGLLKNWREIN